LFLTLLFSLSSLWPTDARGVQEHKSLNDSIQKYKQIAPNKAIDFAFDAINLVDHDNPTIDLVSTYSLLGEILGLYDARKAILKLFLHFSHSFFFILILIYSCQTYSIRMGNHYSICKTLRLSRK
jgi:hypothetical protein